MRKNNLRLQLLDTIHPGAVTGPISWLHRHPDGFVSFMSRDPATRKLRPWKSVTVEKMRSQRFLPLFQKEMSEDGFVSVNAFYRGDSRKTNDLRYLNAAFVDLDFYVRDNEGSIVRLLDWPAAVALLLDMGDRGLIPPPSIYIRSGNGAWLLWLLADEANPEQSPRWWPESGERLKRIQTAMRDRIRTFAPELRPDENAADLSRVTRVPGSQSSKAGSTNSQVAWIGAFDAPGNLPSYRIAELGEFFHVHKRPLIPQRNQRRKQAKRKTTGDTPKRNNAGYRALHERRLTELHFLSAHRNGFPSGIRRQVLWVMACFMAMLGVDRDEIRREIEEEAARCRPPFPRGEALEIANRTVTEKRYRFTNLKLADMLHVTMEEVRALEDGGTPLEQIRPDFVPKKERPRERKRDSVAYRRELLRQETTARLDATGKLPKQTALVAWLETREIYVTSETVRHDLMAVGLHRSQIPAQQGEFFLPGAPTDGTVN